MFAYTLCMSKRYLLYIMNVSKISFLHYDRSNLFFVCVRMTQRCLLFSLWMSQRCYGCLKDVFCTLWLLKYVFCTLWMSQRCLFFIMDVSKMLWMSQRYLFYIMNVSKKSLLHYDRSNMFFVCYECLKDVFFFIMDVSKMLWMSKRCLLYIMIAQRYLFYIMNVSKKSLLHYDRSNMFFVCYECLKDVFFFHYGCLK